MTKNDFQLEKDFSFNKSLNDLNNFVFSKKSMTINNYQIKQKSLSLQ